MRPSIQNANRSYVDVIRSCGIHPIRSHQAYRQALPDDRGNDAGVGGVSGAANARIALYQVSQNLTTMNPKMGAHALTNDHRDQETTALSGVFEWGSMLYVRVIRVKILNTFSGIHENERKLIN